MVQRFLQLGMITVGLVKVGTAITKITSHTPPAKSPSTTSQPFSRHLYLLISTSMLFTQRKLGM